jgi:hypothetical protein
MSPTGWRNGIGRNWISQLVLKWRQRPWPWTSASWRQGRETNWIAKPKLNSSTPRLLVDSVTSVYITPTRRTLIRQSIPNWTYLRRRQGWAEPYRSYFPGALGADSVLGVLGTASPVSRHGPFLRRLYAKPHMTHHLIFLSQFMSNLNIPQSMQA